MFNERGDKQLYAFPLSVENKISDILNVAGRAVW